MKKAFDMAWKTLGDVGAGKQIRQYKCKGHYWQITHAMIATGIHVDKKLIRYKNFKPWDVTSVWVNISR